MTEPNAPYTADPPPDGPTPLPPGALTPYNARLDNALWRAQATSLLRTLLDASHRPADWPRDQNWPQTVLLPHDAATQIAALLADPPVLAVVPVAEFDRVLSMLERVAAERDALRVEDTRHHAVNVALADVRSQWEVRALTAELRLAETQAEVTRLHKDLMTARAQCNRISATLCDERVAAAKAAMRTDAAPAPTPAGVKR
jgi:hypothetical protein